jgi:hypothetical protein
LQQADDALTLSFGDQLRLRLGPQLVVVEDSLGPAPFTVTVPQESEAEAVAAELRVLTRDACFHDALAALGQRFAAS